MQIKKSKVYERIYEEALSLFLSKGYKATKIRDISENAKVTASNIYSYFPNKDFLFKEVVGRTYNLFFYHLKVDFKKREIQTEEELIVEYFKIFMNFNFKAIRILLNSNEGVKYCDFKKRNIEELIKAYKKVGDKNLIFLNRKSGILLSENLLFLIEKIITVFPSKERAVHFGEEFLPSYCIKLSDLIAAYQKSLLKTNYENK